MAEIPDVGGRGTPRSNRAIVTDRSGLILGDALEDVGGELGRVGEELEQKRNRFALAKAKSSFLRADLEARAELEQDQDFTTHEQRYREKLGKARDAATDMIEDQEQRTFFGMEADLDLERGVAAVRQRARSIETDSAMADLSTMLDGNRAAALQAKDEPTRAAIIQNSMEAIAAAREQYGDSFTELDATKLRQQWTHDYAEASIAMMPASQRVAVLKNPKNTAAAFLQPDERAKLLKAAEDEDKELRIRSSSQDQSDRIMEAHSDRGEALAAARAIKDPEIRDATTTRVNARFAELEAIDNERNDKAFTDAATLVEQKGSIDGIDVRTWQTVLTQSQRVALEARAKQLRDGIEPTTDIALWYERRQEAADHPAAFAKRNLMDDRHLLADGDFKGLAEIQAAIRDGNPKADQLLSGVRTATQVVDDTLRQIGIDPSPKPGTTGAEQVARFSRAVDERVMALQTVTGHKATTEEVQGIVDELVVKGEVPGRTFFGLFSSSDDKFLFEIEDGEAFSVTAVDQVPAADRRQIEAALKKRGRPVTSEAVLTLYNAGRAQ
jgi:hypothetical protein